LQSARVASFEIAPIVSTYVRGATIFFLVYGGAGRDRPVLSETKFQSFTSETVGTAEKENFKIISVISGFAVR